LFATTRQFLDDLGLAALDQLPLLSQVDSPISALAGMLDESPAQASLSLEEALAESAESSLAGEPRSAAAFTEAANAPQNELSSPALSDPLGDDHSDANLPDVDPANPGHGQENTPT
jgi:segregation and condensation protein B